MTRSNSPKPMTVRQQVLNEGAAANRGGDQAVLEELEPRSPKAKGQDPKRFFDDRFVRELQASGFIDASTVKDLVTVE